MKTKTLLALSTALITSLGVNEGEASFAQSLVREALLNKKTPLTREDLTEAESFRINLEKVHIERARLHPNLDTADPSLLSHNLPLNPENRRAYHGFRSAQVENPTREQIEGWARINGPYQTLHRRLFEIGLPLADFTEDYRTAYTAFSAGPSQITRNKLQTWVAIEGQHQAAYRGLVAQGVPLGDITDDYRVAYTAFKNVQLKDPSRKQIETWVAIEGQHQDVDRCLYVDIMGNWYSPQATLEQKIIGARQCINLMDLQNIPVNERRDSYEILMDMSHVDPHDYSELQAVHQRIRDNQGQIYNEQDFNAALTQLHHAMDFLPQVRQRLTGSGLSLNYAYNKIRLESDFRADQTHGETTYNERIVDLNEHLDGVGLYQGRAFTLGDQVWDAELDDFRGVEVDLRSEMTACNEAVDLLMRAHDPDIAVQDPHYETRYQPLALNYVNLTRNDYWGQLLHLTFPVVSLEAFRDIQDDCISVIYRLYPGEENAQMRHQLIAGQEVDHHAHVGLNPAFNRFRGEGRAQEENWCDKIAALYNNLHKRVDTNIPRPNTEGYNPQAWQTALDQEKMIMIRHIIETKNGCKDGTSSKISTYIDLYRNVLDMYTPKVGVTKAIAQIIYNWKIENINKIGAESAGEAELMQPLLVKQRLRLPLSLPGTYQHIQYLGISRPTDPRNHPLQVIRNLFEANQPIRQGILERPNVTFQPLTVNGLVEKVVAEMQDGGSIKLRDIQHFISGDRTLTLDQRNTIFGLKDDTGDFDWTPTHGVFFKTDALHRTKEMALFLLEKMGYVRIDKAVKDVFYKGEFPLTEDGQLDENRLSQNSDTLAYRHQRPGYSVPEACSLKELIEAY